MQTLEHQVLQKIVHWIAKGNKPWLCTIVRTVGSSPRPVGSMLGVLGSSGEQAGTVSGGCVEDDLLETIQSGGFSDQIPQLAEYGVSAEQNERLGLPCGGRLTLLIQQLSEFDVDWIETSLRAIDERRCVQRHVELATGQTRMVEVPKFTSMSLSETQLQQCFGPRMRMLLVGAGQLSQSLSELAIAMDYEVLVTDPRKELLDQWTGPDVELIQGMPDDVIRMRANDRHSIVITLTHDPRIDDMALLEALESEAWYVGALGSVRTTEKRIDRLRELNLTTAQISKLHAPVGLSIGSKSLHEISIAIMAELIQLRSKLSTT